MKGQKINMYQVLESIFNCSNISPIELIYYELYYNLY